MKLLILQLSLALLFISNEQSNQNILERCDSSTISNIIENIENITPNQIQEFLYLVNTPCIEKVEFSEMVNEALFLLIDYKTESVLKTISSVHKNVQMDLIYEMLENPINDNLDLMKVTSSISNSKSGNKKIRKRLLNSLKKALGKNK